MGYKPEYFTVEECVPKDYAKKYGEKCWELFDDRALKTLDVLREEFGPITINNYKWGGSNQYRGLRTPDYYGSFEKYTQSRSQHKYGRAFDLTFKNHSAKYVRERVLEQPEKFPYITFLETGISWFHFDVRNTTPIKLWHPEKGFVDKNS